MSPSRKSIVPSNLSRKQSSKEVSPRVGRGNDIIIVVVLFRNDADGAGESIPFRDIDEMALISRDAETGVEGLREPHGVVWKQGLGRVVVGV